MVAICFVSGRTQEKNEVNHKDFNRQNNRYDNLEWISHADNIRYSAEAGRKSQICGDKNPNYHNTTLKEFYDAHPEISLIKQSRPGSKNGRSIPVTVYQNDILIGHFDYLGQCCDYMNEHYHFNTSPEVFRCGVRRSNRSGTPYKGFTFIK